MAARRPTFPLTKRPKTVRHGKELRGAPPRRLLDRIEIASRDEIAALQLERLRWSLQHAWSNVPRYREKFAAAGIHPDDLRSLDDLARFPFTTKEGPPGHLPVRDVRRPRGGWSDPRVGGTTGKPTVVGYTAKDIGTWAALVAVDPEPRAGAPATSSRSLTATGSSPAASVPTTAPSGSGAR
ncbi:MAG: hypothetical protein R2882_10635 [Gemmatimonadales bacterium]